MSQLTLFLLIKDKIIIIQTSSKRNLYIMADREKMGKYKFPILLMPSKT